MNELTANMKTEEAIKEKIRESRFESINGKDLMEMDLPPLHYTISTILPHGFFILAGGAKVGKFVACRADILRCCQRWANLGLSSPYNPKSCISVWKIP